MELFIEGSRVKKIGDFVWQPTTVDVNMNQKAEIPPAERYIDNMTKRHLKQSKTYPILDRYKVILDKYYVI
jgi:hypothetical protein